MKRGISNILIVLLLACAIMPALSTEEKIAQHILDALRDAEADINKNQWLSLGCFCGPMAYAASLTRTPAVPTERLVGKSSEYLDVYSEEYRRKRKALQVVLFNFSLRPSIVLMRTDNSS